MPVQFGVAIRNFVGPGETPDVEALLRYAERAEELGFESLWAWDHILLGVDPSFPVLDSLTILTAIAVRTKRIRLGTGVMVLPLRNPVVAAKVLASLDQISKGRLLLGRPPAGTPVSSTPSASPSRTAAASSSVTSICWYGCGPRTP